MGTEHCTMFSAPRGQTCTCNGCFWGLTACRGRRHCARAGPRCRILCSLCAVIRDRVTSPVGQDNGGSPRITCAFFSSSFFGLPRLGRYVSSRGATHTGNGHQVAYTAPHTPYQALDHLVDHFADVYPPISTDCEGGDPEPCRHPRAVPAAMMLHVDQGIGQIIDALTARGMWEDTVTVSGSACALKGWVGGCTEVGGCTACDICGAASHDTVTVRGVRGVRGVRVR